MKKSGKVALFLFCLLLTAGIFGFIGWRVITIQQQAEVQRAEAEARAKAEAEAALQVTPEPTETPTPTPTPTPLPTDTPTPTPTPEPTPEPLNNKIISIRGDSMIYEGEEGAEITEEGYPAKLQKLIDADGIDFTVEDYTWFMAGTLSQMRLAGVSEEVVNAYVEAHRSAAEAAGVEPDIYEVVIRDDLDAKMSEKERDDQAGIPVICMGLNGGWNNDPYELIEQQQKILDTYEQKEHYVIMGLYPSYFTADDIAYYDSIFTEQWGDHFLSLSYWMVNDPMTDAGREEIAALLYEKLTEVGYFEEASGEAASEDASDDAEATGETADETAGEAGESAVEAGETAPEDGQTAEEQPAEEVVNTDETVVE